MGAVITEEMYLTAKKIVEAYEEAQVDEAVKVPDVVCPKLRPVQIKEIGKQYYWQRKNWKPEFSGMVTIKSEGGSQRVKGWQVVYVDDEKSEMCLENAGLSKGTYCTQFADDSDLFEVVSE